MDARVAAGPIAGAFGLGALTEAPAAVGQPGAARWKFTTESGSYLVKRLWAGEDPPWWRHVAAKMDFERRVRSATPIVTARPVEPERPAFGCAARVGEQGVFRAYEWLDHRDPGSADDLTDWVARTLVALHGVAPAETGLGSAWDCFGVYPEATWRGWITAASDLDRAWAGPLGDHMDTVLGLSKRLTAAWERADDRVATHGDFEPYNVLITADGPALVDWESVCYESATMEAGRAALAFGGSDPQRVAAILRAYREAGGRPVDLGPDRFLRTSALTLCHITELVRVSLGELPPSGWMDAARLDAEIADRIRRLPGEVAALTRLADHIGAL
ncbi:aminoglycoside phosphotransferase family protein [Nocardiopsis sediminis]|uniref:Aminoglycoside phosphotransferase family protein n=1 Tax=Nocardiopsis sediminis TaxID=1778267 RepID=A0ABV8FKG0_9ACTN